MDQTLMTKMASWLPWGKFGKRSSEEDEDSEGNDQPPNLLLSLLFPDVTNSLLDYLDPRSLRALRLTCRRTKWWVDQPKYLVKLPITLHASAGTKKMRKVLRSKTDFCHFKIGLESCSNEDLIYDFGHRFGPFIRVLEISTITIHDIAMPLIAHCPCLDTLSLLGLNLLNMGPTEMAELQSLHKVFASLRTLSVGNVLFVEEQEMEYFRKFLQLCTNLQSIRLPYVNFQSKRAKEVRDDVLEKYVLEPVLNSMLERGHYSPQGNMKYLILEYLNPLPPQLFFRVAEVCFKFKTILHNVHESHLKRAVSEGDKKLAEAHAVQEIIGTLDGLNATILLGRLLNLKCISIWVSAATKLSDTNYHAPTLPKLVNINLYVDTVEDDGGHNIQRLVSTILGHHPRPTVTSLKISYNSRKVAVSAELVRAVDIAHNFQYLRKLDIYQWDAFDEEFITLWKGLGSHRIQELSLLLCTNLSDRGLLGTDPKNPAILKLTGLQELHVSSLYGSITDATIYRALRHMPLHKLRMYSQSITYDGIASLLEGPCSQTVDYIHCSKPLDCTQKEFYYLIKDILNAKNSPEVGKKRHPRRRSQPLVFFAPTDTEEDQE